MPSSQKTPILQLNQWAGSDIPATREDLNTDNQKIDTAYGQIMNLFQIYGDWFDALGIDSIVSAKLFKTIFDQYGTDISQIKSELIAINQSILEYSQWFSDLGITDSASAQLLSSIIDQHTTDIEALKLASSQQAQDISTLKLASTQHGIDIANLQNSNNTINNSITSINNSISNLVTNKADLVKLQNAFSFTYTSPMILTVLPSGMTITGQFMSGLLGKNTNGSIITLDAGYGFTFQYSGSGTYDIFPVLDTKIIMPNYSDLKFTATHQIVSDVNNTQKTNTNPFTNSYTMTSNGIINLVGTTYSGIPTSDKFYYTGTVHSTFYNPSTMFV